MSILKKTTFKLPYAGFDHYGGLDLLYSDRGDFSVVFGVTNPVQQYAGDPSGYDAFHTVIQNLVGILGQGHLIEKQDLFIRRKYAPVASEDYLRQRYGDHFRGREYTAIQSYLVLTRQVKRGAFYVFKEKELEEFLLQVRKVSDLLVSGGFAPRLLSSTEINTYLMCLLGMDFTSDGLVLDNIKSGDQQLEMGGKSLRCISLVDTDHVDMPEELSTHRKIRIGSNLHDFPSDNLGFLLDVPDYKVMVYNQVIEVPLQQLTLNKLELKRKRHSGVPDPANNICVEDIDRLLTDVARENQLLVNAHFNILVCTGKDQLAKPCNFIETELFRLGIIPSRNAYNQLELFRTVLPGNALELKTYDWFLTTLDAALCLWFRESLPRDEPSDFVLRFTDRQGIPIAIDPSDLPMRTGRINARNRFCLGPSGSGKSYLVNNLVEQYLGYNMDVVIIDTGHSYSGLCAYFGGKYITYSESSPITMNPFAFGEEEYNIEKKDFLCTLIGLAWKGADGELGTVERDVISSVISAYYSSWFSGEGIVGELKFDTFYDYACRSIPVIKAAERILFDFDEFRYVLKKFCSGGEFGSLLNEQADQSLFSERFVVYEVDAIKGHKVLFPLATLIIMDVFIQKMRNRTHRRKALIIEEAWKAVSSPLMSGTLVYLYKTVRKFWGEVMVVTQELGDIVGNAVVKDSIIANSDTFFLLDQSKFRDRFDEIAALLSINEVERRKIFSINMLNNKEGRSRFKEVYIRRGATGEVYGVENSLHQYLIYTTEKPEKVAVESYVVRYGSYREGLDAFVSDLKSSGLELSEFVSLVNGRHSFI